MSAKEYELDSAEMLEDMICSSQVFLLDDIANQMVRYAVNCNDLWSWASADAEEIPYDEIENCYKLGPTTWACVRRNLRPFDQCEEAMRKSGRWNELLETLPAREK